MPEVSTYNANKLHHQLLDAMHIWYPGWSNLRLIFYGDYGCGKSTVAASVPVPEGTRRVVLDMENSMAYLDGGLDGKDIYTPLRMSFAMRRSKFPNVNQILWAYRQLAHPDPKPEETFGALIIDNISLFQEAIVAWIRANAANPENVRNMWRSFDATSALPPANATIEKWAKTDEQNIWRAAKGICRSFLLACDKASVHFVATAETTNVWENYGTKDQKKAGIKARLWDAWLQLTDAVLILKRDPNKREPPKAQVGAYQPKMRMQGMMPTWVMDWDHYIKEIVAATQRTQVEIPEEYQVHSENLTEESEAPNLPATQPEPTLAGGDHEQEKDDQRVEDL